jgi:hypothetical protein
MAERKARTDAQKDRAKDIRLQRKYGITLADRVRRAEEQKHLCAMCGGPLEAHGPAQVDHFHFRMRTDRIYDTVLNTFTEWETRGYDELDRVICVRRAPTRKSAEQAVKAAMLPWAVRALLCAKCNRGAGINERFFDVARHPNNLMMLIHYFQARLEKPLTQL